MAGPNREYLYVSPQRDVAVFSSDALDATSERHKVSLSIGSLTGGADPLDEIRKQKTVSGVVVGLTSGLPDRRRLRLLDAALSRGLRAWLYWPDEQAVECVDRERLRSLRRHRL